MARHRRSWRDVGFAGMAGGDGTAFVLVSHEDIERREVLDILCQRWPDVVVKSLEQEEPRTGEAVAPIRPVQKSPLLTVDDSWLSTAVSSLSPAVPGTMCFFRIRLGGQSRRGLTGCPGRGRKRGGTGIRRGAACRWRVCPGSRSESE